eukprot:scaffold246510_cov20-Tisochrysis_lutea.AAC.1
MPRGASVASRIGGVHEGAMHDSRAVTVATSGGSAASAPPKVGHRKWVLIIVIKVTAHVPHQQRVSKGRERRRAAFQLPCKGCGAAGACATLLLRTCLGCACVLRTRNCSSSGSNVAGLAMWGATLLSLLRAQGRELRQRFFSRSCSLTQLACLRGRPRALWGAVLVAGGAGAVGGGRLRVVQCNVGREGRPAALSLPATEDAAAAAAAQGAGVHGAGEGDGRGDCALRSGVRAAPRAGSLLQLLWPLLVLALREAAWVCCTEGAVRGLLGARWPRDGARPPAQ